MTQETVAKEICNFIKENLVAETVEIKPDSSLSAIGLDSFSTIEIVLFIERKFDVGLPDEALTPENIESPNAIAACTLQYAWLSLEEAVSKEIFRHKAKKKILKNGAVSKGSGYLHLTK